MDTRQTITEPETYRNAPNVKSTLSAFVDVAQAAVDDARAAGLYPLADEIDAIRRRAAALAMRVWGMR